MFEQKKIIKVNQKLSNLKINDNFEYSIERSKLIVKRNTPFLYTVILIFFTIFAFLCYFLHIYSMTIIFLIIVGFTFYFKFIFKSYCVIDYNDETFYIEKRNNNDICISKKIICKFKDIIAVGVNNGFRHASKFDKLEDTIDGYIKQSAVVFLKNDGTLLYFDEFKDTKDMYDNNRIISDTVSEYFNIPKLSCSPDKQFVVLNNGSSFILDEENLEKESKMLYGAKFFALTFVLMVIAVIFTFILLKANDIH